MRLLKFEESKGEKMTRKKTYIREEETESI